MCFFGKVMKEKADIVKSINKHSLSTALAREILFSKVSVDDGVS